MSIKSYLAESRDKEVNNCLEDLISKLNEEGLQVKFGNIGVRTTYALVHNEDHEIEYVGLTFIRNMKFYNKSVGKLKALQQALARKELASIPK